MAINKGQYKWTSLVTANREDILALDAADEEWAALLPARILAQLQALRGRHAGFGMPVDRLEHSIQCATRAYHDNRSNEYVICALVHDIGDGLAPYDHATLAACVLKPFVSERLHWIVAHHALFQGYYYFHHLGQDRFARERHCEYCWYGDAVEFCERFDQCSFDPGYVSHPLEFFEPAIREVMGRHRSAPELGCTSIEAAELARLRD